MERLELGATMRPRMTKGMIKRARKEVKVPAMLYSRGKETYVPISDGRSLKQQIFTGGSNVLINLQIKETGKEPDKKQLSLKRSSHITLKKTDYCI